MASSSSNTYSERFLSVAGFHGWSSWTVPYGYRAIVTDISSANDTASSAALGVYVGGTQVFRMDYPAQPGHVTQTCRVVAYGGESIATYTSGLSLSLNVSGYLFVDDSMRTGPLETISQHPEPPAPSWAPDS